MEVKGKETEKNYSYHVMKSQHKKMICDVKNVKGEE